MYICFEEFCAISYILFNDKLCALGVKYENILYLCDSRVKEVVFIFLNFYKIISINYIYDR
jgi:hypothetical protein